MDSTPLYDQEMRREPRIALSWRATVQTAISGMAYRFDGTTVNISSAGMCLRGPLPEALQQDKDTQVVVDLALPGGEHLRGMEAALVWVRVAGEATLSGWRWTRVRRETRRVLQQELGMGPVLSPGPVPGYEYWDEDEIELWDYVKVLVRRRWLVAACTLLLALSAYAYARVQSPVYTAEAQVYSIGDADQLNLGERIPATRYAPYLPVLNSRQLNRRMVHRPYTIELPQGEKTRTLVEWSVARTVNWNVDEAARLLEEASSPVEDRRRELGTINWLQNMSNFDQGRDGVLTIRVSAEFPDLAAAIANGYVDELGHYLIQTRTTSTQRHLAMAAARMDTLQRELRHSQRALENFKVTNQNLLRNMTDLNLLMPEVGTRLDSLQRELGLKERLYNTVSEQYELLRLQREKEATGLEVISQAEPPLRPRSNTRKYTLLGGVAGLFMGVFGAFVVEYVDNKRQSGDLTPITAAWQEDVGRIRRIWR